MGMPALRAKIRLWPHIIAHMAPAPTSIIARNFPASPVSSSALICFHVWRQLKAPNAEAVTEAALAWFLSARRPPRLRRHAKKTRNTTARASERAREPGLNRRQASPLRCRRTPSRCHEAKTRQAVAAASRFPKLEDASLAPNKY